MESQYLERAKQLLQRGENLAGAVKRSERYGPHYWYPQDQISEVRSWFDSVFNIFRLTTTPDMHYHKEINKTLNHKSLRSGAPFWAVQKLCGNLTSLIEEAELGLLKKPEYVFTASAFDDFLDHAEDFHRAGKKIESSVLSSIVFENTLRKISSKHKISSNDDSIDLMIDYLAKADVFTTIRAKRIKAYAAVRNKALHAKWDEIQLRDVDDLIKGVRELLESYLM